MHEPHDKLAELRRQGAAGRPDIAAGVAVCAVGLAVMWIAWGYPLGTLRRMGAGYLPLVLGGVLVLLGLSIALIRPDTGLRVARQPARPILCVLGSIAVFAVVCPYGILPAIMLSVPLAVFAQPGASVVEALVLAAGIAAMVAAIFIWALGVPLPLLRI